MLYLIFHIAFFYQKISLHKTLPIVGQTETCHNELSQVFTEVRTGRERHLSDKNEA